MLRALITFVCLSDLFCAGSAFASNDSKEADQSKHAARPALVLESSGHTASIDGVAFTPDGEQIISVSSDKTIRVWDVERGENLRVFRVPAGEGRNGMVWAVAASPVRDQRLIAVGGAPNYIYIIDLELEKIVLALSGHAGPIVALSYSPDGKALASSSHDGTSRIWNCESGECLQTLRVGNQPVRSAMFSPDGRKLVTAAWDGSAVIWSVETGQRMANLTGHTREVNSAAWSRDGQMIATSSTDKTIRLWDSNSGRPLKTIDQMGYSIYSVVAFINDSQELFYTAIPGAKQTVGVINFETGQVRVRFQRNYDAIICGALSPDGKLAVTAGYRSEDLRVWRTDSGHEVLQLKGRSSPKWSAGWSWNGKSISWGNSMYKDGPKGLNDVGPLDEAFDLSDLLFTDVPQNISRGKTSQDMLSLQSAGPRLLELRRGDEAIKRLSTEAVGGYFRSCAFWDENQILIGCNLGELSLMNINTGNPVQRFDGHSGTVWEIAPSPDRRYLLTASLDSTLKIWTPDRPSPLLSLFISGPDWIAWTTEGYYAASAGGEKMMGWQVNNGPNQLATFYPASQFRNSLYRPDVIKLLLNSGSVEKALEQADRQRGKSSRVTGVSDVLPPKVEIVAPATTDRLISRLPLKVEARASSVGDHPVVALRLIVNGRPYEGAQGVITIKNPQLGEVREAWDVQLTPGKHQMSVQAESTLSKSVSKPIEVTLADSRAMTRLPDATKQETLDLPCLYVLAVGVSEYDGDLKLNYAARDAEVLAQTLKATSATLYRNIEVNLLTDKKATRKDFLQGLTWLRKQMTQRDVAILMFAGHGTKDSDGNFYLLPVDVDVEDLLSSAVPGDQIKRTLGSIPGKVIVLLDACHSGSVDGEQRRAATSLTDDLVRDLVTDDYGVIVMCSAMGREFALESAEIRQGYFTHAIVEGLSGKADYNKDGVVHFNELDLYSTDRVKELAHGKQHPVTAKPTSIRSFPVSKP